MARSRPARRTLSYYKLPLVYAPQPEGGYTVTCPLLPELLTEGDTLEEAQANVTDALAAVLEIYKESGRDLPTAVRELALNEPLLTRVWYRSHDLSRGGTLRNAVKQLGLDWDDFMNA